MKNYWDEAFDFRLVLRKAIMEEMLVYEKTHGHPFYF